ncbi:hypothetical protein SAMN05421541_105538 [Actinoplanes philippinensis]|uniref:Uncharacterized protein n=1 Tax=Actinoplanes philippinensis TaxID=35752 RepID=A0A1I2FPG4_9ACTN|nr:hypothetical protein SAMN05421541_105538 [Actinoplanes philippinensis]
MIMRKRGTLLVVAAAAVRVRALGDSITTGPGRPRSGPA